MRKTHWPYVLAGLALISGGPSVVLAQETMNPSSAANTASATGGHFQHRGRPSGRGGFGFAASLEKNLSLTQEQKDAVHGVLAQQRQQSAALREQSDQKIRGLLNPDQQKKFDSMVAEQKARRSHPAERS